VNFTGPNGGNPNGMTLVQAHGGDLWGVTLRGGATWIRGEQQGYGIIFKMTPAGGITTVYSFCSKANCTDGSYPYAGPIQAADGNFYGTTAGGGAYGWGSIYKITPDGKLTTLYSFCKVKGCPDGTNIYAGLVQGSDGDLYGVADEGGEGAGTVFKITTDGAFKTIHNFTGSDGSQPMMSLIQATNGLFYGTTYAGGAHGLGTAFQITPSGTLTTLHSFCDCADGQYPLSSLVQGSDGNFYGTTYDSGAYGYGTIFRISPDGAFKVLHSFYDDGAGPQAQLIQGTDGNFYGTTSHGDGNSEPCVAGCVFSMTPEGKLTNLFQFDSDAVGLEPEGGLTEDTNGNIYGSTYVGGTGGEGADGGTLFMIPIGLPPFVIATPGSGTQGAPVAIFGTDLAGATKVSFNGTRAEFHVISGSEISTTVPADATTGEIEVVTHGETLKSNPAFRVVPRIARFTPTSGDVGSLVTITGTELKGATEVTFDGIKAKTFTAISANEITAKVPAGANSGKIAVTTAGGTATSAEPFAVTK
jgi:uncharacterized repeat protein (TIGR03803 family)